MPPKQKSSANAPVTPTSTSTVPDSILPRNMFSPEVVREHLNTPDISAKYASTPQIVQSVEFRRGKSTDILVLKRNADSEFILRGVYQIARNDFYFIPDGCYDPENPFQSRFQDVKLSCCLTAPQSSDFEFAQEDFPACIDNLRSIEKSIKPNKDNEILSSITTHLGSPQFKLSHALLEPKTPLEPNDVSTTKQIADTETLPSTSDDETLDSVFAMETWPVAPRCKHYLDELFDSHDICPLPAYDMKGNLIPPTQYETSLRGATVKVHFTYSHVHIKKSKHHVYTTILRHLQLLRAPNALPSSPYKRLRVSASASSFKTRS
ncbi:hypothetical protein JVT61DRAFT_8826 [Boletus reticuloceps]|uniref:Uncharacterized protein n=1 Tax=Boletus reticuloceps TaxID=495285 RepID=A0A8I2YI40_9AGAM|nr:hypothetical protein JVT61DRAFT_8826 [Boletus reticuloceps]